MTLKAAKVIKELFDTFMEDYGLLPPQYRGKAAAAGDPSGETVHQARIVADYIAGMTDRFAIREHARLFSPGELS